jgi:hypothetical protein
MAKVLCVFFDDPADGYAPADARVGLAVIDLCSGDQAFPTQRVIDVVPGALLDGVSGALRGPGFVAMALFDLVESLATHGVPPSSVPALSILRPGETQDFQTELG